MAYIKNFNDFDEALYVNWPNNAGNGVTWQSGDTNLTGYSQGIGVDYPHDMMGESKGTIGPGKETVRRTIFASTAEALLQAILEYRARCVRIGHGYLELALSDSLSWQAEARYTSMSWSFAEDNVFHADISISFDRLSNWQKTSRTAASKTITTTSDSLALDYEGYMPTNDVIFRIRANDSSTPLTQPLVFTNPRNDFTFTLTRSLTNIDEEIKVDCGAGTVEYSSDNGANYVDDSSHLTLPAGQVNIMELWPDLGGDTNDIAVTCAGTPNFDVESSYLEEF